jgi:hypothetical protein
MFLKGKSKMPSTEKKVGEIQGYTPDEKFDVVVETDADNILPKYVYVRNQQTGQFETSFYFDHPTGNCPLSRAAAMVAGSLGHLETVSFEGVIENISEVIDWADTLSMQNGWHHRNPTDWSQPSS